MNNARIKILLCIVALLIMHLPVLKGQKAANSGFELFGDDEILNISLKFDLSALQRNKSKTKYLDAKLVYHFNSGDSLINNIRLRARGNSRHKLCSMPPVRLNFSKCDNHPRDLDNISNVKLVTSCNSSKSFKDYLLKEYLAYKLYNVVTDTSFRVRLVKVKYIDSSKKRRVFEQYAFLIEPVTLLERRFKLKEEEKIVVRQQYVNQSLMDKLALFQFFIGNDDWYFPNKHNIKFFTPLNGDHKFMFVVPYDFDYSGMVNAHYAIPLELHGLARITDRIYVGPCRHDETFREIISLFSEHKNDFYSIVNNFGYLADKERAKIIRYFDEFYKLYKSDTIIKMMKKNCEK